MTDLALPFERARAYAAGAIADNTRRAYAADWRDFAAWCDDRGRPQLPTDAETLVLYVTDQADRVRPGTITRRLGALRRKHEAAGAAYPDDRAVRLVLSGIRRRHGQPQQGRAPITTELLRRLVGSARPGPAGLRDRALLLVGFAGAFRRSELAAMELAHVHEVDGGLEIVLPRSKTDQDGQGALVAIPYGANPQTCPVRAWRAWHASTMDTAGPAWRAIDRHGRLRGRLGGRSIARLVKSACARAGIDPEQFAGHSLRAGLATSAALAGVEERDIARQTRHKSLVVLRRYVRYATAWQNNAAGKVGL